MYNKLSERLTKRITDEITDKHIFDEAIRRDNSHDIPNLWRPAFVRDVEKIMNCPYYNRYTDKTQVFSFYKNDDISRRALHVQLVSRIARNIGRMLNLNLDLIEAIAIGHDIGHTPFGHTGEEALSKVYNKHTGKYFQHNIQSVRVLDGIFNYNISLQTLNGILCHNGELELLEYRPEKMDNFDVFDETVSQCMADKKKSSLLIPSTLEGCVVRISDIIAYLGKDRQDAKTLVSINSDEVFDQNVVGSFNAAIINNMIVNIVENSYGKDYISMDKEYFEALKQGKADNYKYIYKTDNQAKVNEILTPMFEKMYEKIYKDAVNKDENSILYKHHVEYVKEKNKYYRNDRYEHTDPDTMTVDFIASMTDDYFVELYNRMFPEDKTIKYISYFEF